MLHSLRTTDLEHPKRFTVALASHKHKKSTLALGTQKPFLDLGLHVLCCPEDQYSSIWMQSVTPGGAEQSLYWFILSFAAQVLLPYTIELDNMC